MSGEVQIRPAGVADADGLADLWVEIGEHLVFLDSASFQVPAVDGLREFFVGLLDRVPSRNRSWLVAELEGELVGQVQAHVEAPVTPAAFQVQRHLGETRLVVDALAVTAGVRRRGIGRGLMGAVEEWGTTRGATHVVLDTFARSPLSVPFYERLGFSWAAVVLEKRI
jgi:GNAT superfamily N-acetyltransferase